VSRGRDGGAAGEEAAYRPPQIVPEAAIAPRVGAGPRGRIEAVGGGGEEQRDGKDVHCGKRSSLSSGHGGISAGGAGCVEQGREGGPSGPAGYDGDMGTLLPIATGRPWCMW
jgi:hypothetical protein